MTDSVRVWHQTDVTEFHRAFGHPAPEWPVLKITDEVKQLLLDRADWIIEEANELKEAAEERNIVKALDALADAEYFAVGGYVVLGHDGQRIWENVHGSNMEKLGSDGKPVPHPTIPRKIGKPEGWVPPEAKHEAYLFEVEHETKIDAMALQIAFLTVTEPETIITAPPLPLQMMTEAYVRAYRLVRGVSREEVIERYNVMAAEGTGSYVAKETER
ncbi:MazG-like nucleotide pyrophosphohydrolase [Microbacterium phage Dewdrop]|nr:MazG-like nucleotide pyrophosphohydrolase [Microbacterium phage Leaf]QGZ17503.1 MazG-like nucleotide pyrophosphohydrolase [Microbacterium phage Dewdrop]